MKICMICLKRRAFGDYYFCSSCYKTHLEDILLNKGWVRELKKMFWRNQKRQRRIRQMEVFLEDVKLVVGNDMEVYPNGEFEI